MASSVAVHIIVMIILVRVLILIHILVHVISIHSNLSCSICMSAGGVTIRYFAFRLQFILCQPQFMAM